MFSSISFHWSLRKVFSSLLAVLWNSAFRWVYLSFSPLPFASLLLFFSWGWFWSLPPVQCYKPPSIVLQVFCLSDLIPWICLPLPLYNHKGFDLDHTWMSLMYSCQEATVRTGHGTTDWLQIGKRVCQGCILSPCLFNLYAEYIMRNAWLDEAELGIKIAKRNINNLRYADYNSLMAESEVQLKNLLMKVKESEKVGVKLNI